MTYKLLITSLFLFLIGCVDSSELPMIFSLDSSSYIRNHEERDKYLEGKITLQEYVQRWEEHVRANEGLKAHELLDEDSQIFFDIAYDELKGIEAIGENKERHNEFWGILSNKFEELVVKHNVSQVQKNRREVVTFFVGGIAVLPLLIAVAIGIRRHRKNKN